MDNEFDWFKWVSRETLKNNKLFINNAIIEKALVNKGNLLNVMFHVKPSMESSSETWYNSQA